MQQNILILNLFLMDPKLCCRYVFPSIRLSKHNFPIQLSPTGPWVGAKPEPGRVLHFAVERVLQRVRDQSRVIDTLVSFHSVPSFVSEMLSSGLDAALGGCLSLSLSRCHRPQSRVSQIRPRPDEAGIKFPFNGDFDGFDDHLNYFVKLTKPRWLCWAGAGIM